MLGNLIDNACKWARARVAVSARADADRVLLAIDDDGPGLPADQRTAVFDRGTRLDESVPGTVSASPSPATSPSSITAPSRSKTRRSAACAPCSSCRRRPDINWVKKAHRPQSRGSSEDSCRGDRQVARAVDEPD